MYFQVSDQSLQIQRLRLLLRISDAWKTRTFLAEEAKRCLILQLLPEFRAGSGLCNTGNIRNFLTNNTYAKFPSNNF